MRCPWLILLLIALPVHAAPGQVTHKTLAEGTPWETQVEVIDTGRPGPTVFLLAGAHGNEPAGFRAARQVSDWSFTKGRLVVVERANHLGLQRAIRYVPQAPKAQRDLNRNFPREPEDEARGPLAEALWKLVLEIRPDWFVDLHESRDFSKRDEDSVGNSVIACPDERAQAVAGKMVAAVNDATIRSKSKRFVVRGPPIAGSIARAAYQTLRIPSMIVETTTKGQSLSYRTRQHRILMRTLFADLGMYEGQASVILPPNAPPGVVRVAVYDSTGSMNSTGPAVFNRILRAAPKIEARRINRHDIRAGSLQPFDILVMPGGSASSQGKALGEEGREAIRAFVAAGGGYYGSCAGTYLATANYSWSLNILDAKTIDRAHWKRGKKILQIQLNRSGRQVFGRQGSRVDVLYANGPILGPADLDEIPDFEVLAVYETEVARNGAKKGVMPGTPALVRGCFGKGRVWCTGPHPEYDARSHDMVLAGVRWLTDKD